MSARFREVESARGLAAAAVLVYHLGFVAESSGWSSAVTGITAYGWLGVSVFFVISGFLLYRPFLDATLNGAPWPSISRYARSRVLRIVPAYWAMLLILLILGRGLLSSGPLLLATVAGLAMYLPGPVQRRFARRPYLFAAATIAHIGIASLAARSAVMDPAAAIEATRNLLFLYAGSDGWFVQPAWTLAIEISFYAALPFGALAIARTARGDPSRVVAVLVALVALGVSYRAAMATVAPGLPVILPGYIDQFALGMLVAVAAARRIRIPTSLFAAALAAALASAMLASRLDQFEAGAMSSVFLAPIVALAFALVLLRLVHDGAAPLRGRLPEGLGRVSYGVYLWHLPVLVAVVGGVGAQADAGEFVLRAVVAVVVTIALASASWRYVERPALGLRGGEWSRRRDTQVAPVLGVGPASRPAATTASG